MPGTRVYFRFFALILSRGKPWGGALGAASPLRRRVCLVRVAPTLDRLSLSLSEHPELVGWAEGSGEQPAPGVGKKEPSYATGRQ